MFILDIEVMSKLMITILLSTVVIPFSYSGCTDKEGTMDQSANTPQTQQANEIEYETATFAAGCFWGIQEKFRKTPGVVNTAAGYIGGILDEPTYKQVCTDKTGHAEAVEVTYDPSRITYEELLAIFWNMHDPTTLNRQGPDIGTQYRSAIFYHNDTQKQLAESSKKQLMKIKKVVTEIVPAGKFWPAEEYHQFYLMKKGIDSCGIDGH